MSQETHVLVIDDDRGTRETLSDVLRLRNYTVETAGNGQEGFKKLSTRPFDVAIVDIKLPDISGSDLLPLMKEASPEMEVILITAFASLNSAIQAISAEAFAYITKPFEMDHLLFTLEKALEKRRLAMEYQKLYQMAQQNLAERKQAEEVLQQSEAKFYKLFEFASEAIVAVNRDGHIALVNTKAESLFGYPREELLGRSVEMLIPERLRDGHAAHCTRYLSQPSSRPMGSGVKLYGVRKDGHEFPAEISLNPIETEKGILVTTTILDISSLKEAEEERDLLLAETKRNLEYISALYSVTSAASESLDLNAVLQEVIKKITEIFHFDATRIFLFNSQMDELPLRASFEIKPELWSEVSTFKRGQGNVGRVAETGEPLVFEDVQRDPQYQKSSQTKNTQRFGFSFFAVFPIKVTERTVGTIVFIGQDPRRLTANEIKLINSMAQQIAVAVENANLFEATAAKTNELSALYSVATVVNQSLDINLVLRSVMRKVLEIFDFDAARIYLYDENKKELRLLAHQGFPQDAFPPDSYKPGQGILGKIFERGEPILFEDIQTDPEFNRMVYKRIALRAGFRGSFGIPIRVKDRTLGVINFVSKNAHRFLPNEVQLIHSIADHVGIAVVNAKLYEQTKEQALQLEKDITDREQAEKALKDSEGKLRRSHRELRAFSARLVSVREEEKGLLAREIHDELGQALTALKMDISWLARRLRKSQNLEREKARSMSKLIGETIEAVRKISTELRPGLLDDLGLVAAVEWYTQEFQNRARIKCEFTSIPGLFPIDIDISTGAFRIVQEALTNIARHAKATRVDISLTEGEGVLVLKIRDNGKGITKKEISDSTSLGLLGMRERTIHLGGELDIKTIKGGGTIVTAVIPLRMQKMDVPA